MSAELCTCLWNLSLSFTATLLTTLLTLTKKICKSITRMLVKNKNFSNQMWLQTPLLIRGVCSHIWLLNNVNKHISRGLYILDSLKMTQDVTEHTKKMWCDSSPMVNKADFSLFLMPRIYSGFWFHRRPRMWVEKLWMQFKLENSCYL